MSAVLDARCEKCGDHIAASDADVSLIRAAEINHRRYCRATGRPARIPPPKSKEKPMGNHPSLRAVTPPPAPVPEPGVQRPAARDLVEHPDVRIRAAAVAILSTTAELDRLWDRWQQTAELRSRREQLLKELASLDDELGTAPPPPAPSAADIREWCAAQGITVNGHGKIPNAIVEAFRQAHQ